MQINASFPGIAAARPQPTPSDQPPSAEQEIKRLVTQIKAAEVGARVAPATRSAAATQEIQRIATMVTAALAGAPVDPGRNATERAATGYTNASQTTSRPQTAQLLMTA